MQIFLYKRFELFKLNSTYNVRLLWMILKCRLIHAHLAFDLYTNMLIQEEWFFVLVNGQIIQDLMIRALKRKRNGKRNGPPLLCSITYELHSWIKLFPPYENFGYILYLYCFLSASVDQQNNYACSNSQYDFNLKNLTNNFWKMYTIIPKSPFFPLSS